MPELPAAFFNPQIFGTSWTAVSGFPTASILSLAASGIHDVFVGVGNNFLVSTNSGASWSTSVSWGPLVGIGVFSIAVTTSGSVFAGTGSGVFLSTTDRSTWTSVNSGLTGYQCLLTCREQRQSLCRDLTVATFSFPPTTAQAGLRQALASRSTERSRVLR